MTHENILCLIYGTVVGLIGRKIFMKAIIARILAWFSGDALKKIIKTIPEIVALAEQYMKDGKITAEERKDWVLKAINIIAEKFELPMNWLMRFIISVIIDSVAKKLPSKDIKIPDIIFTIKKEW